MDFVRWFSGGDFISGVAHDMYWPWVTIGLSALSSAEPAKSAPPAVEVAASRSQTQLPVTGCALFSSGVGYFQREGSSYQWEYMQNGRPIRSRAERAILMYDYENFHTGRNGGTRFFLFGDGRVAKP